MGWPKLLVLVRHAECLGNVPATTPEEKLRRFSIPAYAYPLTKRGREQAKRTGEFLRTTYGRFDVCYTSYYPRSTQTMRLMFPRAPLREDPRLAELQEDTWHGLPPAEEKRRKREGPYHYRAPDGENCMDVETRIHSFLETLSREHAGERVLAVVHGTWLILFERIQKGCSVQEAGERIQNGDVAPNASVTVYTCTTEDGKPRLFLESEHLVSWKGQL